MEEKENICSAESQIKKKKKTYEFAKKNRKSGIFF